MHLKSSAVILFFLAATTGSAIADGITEVNASGTTQYFDEAQPAGSEGAVFKTWTDRRAENINPSLARDLEFKIFGYSSTDVYEIHVQQNFSSAGTEIVGLHNYLPVHYLRIFCDDPLSTLTSAELDVKSYAHSNQLNASVTITASQCVNNKFRIISQIYGPSNTIFTTPLALSINKLETQTPQIPAWENPNLNACQKKTLMEAVGHPVPFSISFRCSLLTVS